MDFLILKQLGIALLLGSLIGLEREQKNQKYGKVDTFGGIRTFTLVGVMGALAQIFSDYSIWFFIFIAGGFLGLLISSYVITALKLKKYGFTSEMASMFVFAAGVLCALNQFVLATSLTLVVAVILHFKKSLHQFAKEIKNTEFVSALQFFIIAFVILPLLPNQEFGPFGFFNPYLVWLMVVFISGISYLSYIAVKFLGAKRGIGVTGFFAGFVSSTALALTFSGESKRNPKIVNPYVVAIIVASSAMFFRVLIEVAVINRELLDPLLMPMLSMGITGLIGAFCFWLWKEKTPKNIEKEIGEIKNPSRLDSAIKFGAFFAVILLIVHATDEYLGDNGLYVTSFISGFLDIDAITISVAGLAKNGLSNSSAVLAITIAAITNTLSKGLIFLAFGNLKTALRIMTVFGLMIIVGLGSLFMSSESFWF